MNIAKEEITKQLPTVDCVNTLGNCFDRRGRTLGKVISVDDFKVVYRLGDQLQTIKLNDWPIDRACE